VKKSAIISAVSVLGVAAWFTPAAFGQACAPNAATCRNVKVTVEGNQIRVDPATVTVTGRAAPVKVVWYLATPGYTFAQPGGVTPVDLPAYTKGQFESTVPRATDSRWCYPWQGATTYVCTDRNDDTVNVQYTLKVVAASGTSPAPVTMGVTNN
jgi:hypothetical protein